ncbi:MAG: response regulator [Candidatus Delongbacteria bacterium]|nr:response regulator [Candidatus Delongbacteria bacterium]
MSSNRKNYQIMLVEDNEGDAVLAREALLQIKSETKLLHVYNGDEALEYLYDDRSVKPDLILLDLNLPGMNGLELLQILKKDPATEKIPVIVFSTSNSDSDIRECYRHKADNYITKPIDLSEFFEIFREIDDFMKNKKRECYGE